MSRRKTGWDEFLGTMKPTKKDMKYGTWNVTTPCVSGSLKMAARDLAKYKLDLVRGDQMG
jgi:hypothetical protein